MATLKQLRVELGWSAYKLSQQAGIGYSTAKNAESGKAIPAASAKAIADALSEHLKREIKPWEIEGLNIQ